MNLPGAHEYHCWAACTTADTDNSRTRIASPLQSLHDGRLPFKPAAFLFKGTLNRTHHGRIPLGMVLGAAPHRTVS
jgi:hypothetical protein